MKPMKAPHSVICLTILVALIAPAWALPPKPAVKPANTHPPKPEAPRFQWLTVEHENFLLDGRTAATWKMGACPDTAGEICWLPVRFIGLRPADLDSPAPASAKPTAPLPTKPQGKP